MKQLVDFYASIIKINGFADDPPSRACMEYLFSLHVGEVKQVIALNSIDSIGHTVDLIQIGSLHPSYRGATLVSICSALLATEKDTSIRASIADLLSTCEWYVGFSYVLDMTGSEQVR